jgi:hypothetical protein
VRRSNRSWQQVARDEGYSSARETLRLDRLADFRQALPLGGSFGDFKPGPRHLKKYVTFSLGAGSASPPEAFLCVIAIFVSRHDTALIYRWPPAVQKDAMADLRFKEKLRY